jgi:hypothetical protein
LNIHGINDVRQTGMHTAEPLVPEPSSFEVDIPVEKLKRYKSPGIDQIPAELIQAVGNILLSEIYEFITRNSIWNKEKFPRQWKESIIVGDKIGHSNYREISLLPTTYKIVSNVLVSRSTPCVGEITGDHQCGFQSKRPEIHQIICIHQILEKRWEYGVTLHQLFIDLEKAYDSVRREVLYTILNEFGILTELVRIIKINLKETRSKVRVGENLSDAFPIQNGLKQGDAL